MFLPLEDPDITGSPPLPTRHIIFTCLTVLDPQKKQFSEFSVSMAEDLSVATVL